MIRSIQSLLNTYPRLRPPLTARHQEIYLVHYRASRLGLKRTDRAVLSIEAWMHKQVAAQRHSGRSSILEVGAGTLNHLPYEHSWQRYDVVEPFRELYEDSPQLRRVDTVYTDIDQVPAENRYNRILSVAVLEHLTNLPRVVARSGLLLVSGGYFQAGIPSEGGLLWGTAWRCTTGLLFLLRHGLDYGTLMRHEHLNSAHDIVAIVAYFFRNMRLRRFPLWPLHLSLYTYIEASDPRTEVCVSFLKEAANAL